MDNYKYLKVLYNDKLVGTLAKTPDRLVAFEYDNEWIGNGFSISPFSLPLEKKVFLPKFEPFDGLFGVFNDSLPDGKLKGDILKPFAIHSLSYSKATTLSGVLAKVPTKISL